MGRRIKLNDLFLSQVNYFNFLFEFLKIEEPQRLLLGEMFLDDFR
jgi:hypothetical protein